MHWEIITFRKDKRDFSCKTHTIPEPLLGVVVSDLLARGHSVWERKPAEGWWWDTPGMALVDEGRDSVTVDGLKIEIPWVDFGAWVGYLNETLERGWWRPGPMPWEKLHQRYHCLAVTEAQIRSLLEQSRPMVDEALRKSDEQFERHRLVRR